jgi:SAM-dependent methyltransferase
MNTDEKRHRLQLIRDAWDAYHADYMAFHLQEWPDFHEHFARGGTMLDDYVVEAMGDVRGLRLLDVCCACDAKQAFSWTNLGATVTACDISPRAIEIARENACRIGSDVEFHVADAQTLERIPDGAFDIVFATYLSWFEDLPLAFRNWVRVLRPGGKLLVHTLHPLTFWLDESDGQVVTEHAYARSGPVESEFTSTDLAERHGGWSQCLPCVEFHHTLADMLNAFISAGFHLELVREAGTAGGGHVLSGMPSHIVLAGRRPE